MVSSFIIPRILEDVGISVNKNTVPGDKSALNPSGIRFGTPPLTTRGFGEADMRAVVALIVRALDVAIDVQGRIGRDQHQSVPVSCVIVSDSDYSAGL